MEGELNGLITFYSWHHAMRAEKMLERSGFQVELIPTPRKLSANCGTALRFRYDQRNEAVQALADYKVTIEAVYPYVPELDVGAIQAAATHPLKKRLQSWLQRAIGTKL